MTNSDNASGDFSHSPGLGISEQEKALGFRVLEVGFRNKSDPMGEEEFRVVIVKTLAKSDAIFKIIEGLNAGFYVHRRWGDMNQGFDSWHPIGDPTPTAEQAIKQAEEVNLTNEDAAFVPEKFKFREIQ